MNAQMNRRMASAALIIGFFVFWELCCLAFGIKDIVLPRPTQIIYTLITRMPAIWPHAIQTLYTTLVGFGLGIVFGVALGALVGTSRLAYDVAYPLLIGFHYPEGGDCADPGAVVRRRHCAGGDHCTDAVPVPDHGQRRHRGLPPPSLSSKMS